MSSQRTGKARSITKQPVHKSSRRLTEAGDVVAIATPGHTADHISVVVQDGDTAYFLAGDTSYDEQLMLAGKLDGVSADEQVSRATLDAIGRFTRSRPTVYLPTHDPQSADRLASGQLAAVGEVVRSTAQA